MLNNALGLVIDTESLGGFSFKNLFKKKKKKRGDSPVDMEIRKLEGQQKTRLAQERESSTAATVRRENTASNAAIIAAIAAVAGIGVLYYTRRKKHA